jgi:hypothetical protein
MFRRHQINLIAWLAAATVLMSLAGLTAGTSHSQAQPYALSQIAD